MQACDEFAPGDTRCVCVNDAIFTQDSAWATAGVGAKENNPCNMRLAGDNSAVPHNSYQSPGNGYFARFDTLQNGVRGCVDLYARHYRGSMPDQLVKTWAQSDSKGYHAAVSSCY